MQNHQFDELRNIFLKHDPANVNALENNLMDEYDSEVELFIENIDAMTKNVDGVKELLDYVFTEMFGDYVIDIKEDFIQDVVNNVL